MLLNDKRLSVVRDENAFEVNCIIGFAITRYGVVARQQLVKGRLHQFTWLIQVVVDDRFGMNSEAVVNRGQNFRWMNGISGGADAVLSLLPCNTVDTCTGHDCCSSMARSWPSELLLPLVLTPR